ncbi:hypothetical protein LJR296_001411 [Cupriavidus necator]|uniref:hypothetical protein n=1 Tax=Cupriavidus necator TaxID=106590 RepID=UPI003ECD3567
MTTEQAVARQAARENLIGELIEALQPFVVNNSSQEFITIKVRTADVTRARAAITKARGE